MKVTSTNWQMNAGTAYRSMNWKNDSAKPAESSKLPDTDTLDRTEEALDRLKSGDQDSNSRMKASAPKDSVGQDRKSTRLNSSHIH